MPIISVELLRYHRLVLTSLILKGDEEVKDTKRVISIRNSKDSQYSS